MASPSAAFTTLLLLCRPDFPEATRHLIRERLEDGALWTGVLAAAQDQDVVALAVRGACLACEGWLQAELREGFEIFLDEARARARAAAGELARVLNAHAARGIPVIPFKGPALALGSYGDLALRGCRDLDILVRDADVDASLRFLQTLGYNHDNALNPLQIQAVRRYGGQYILFPRDGLPVEPHWRLAPETMSFRLDYTGLWQRARPGTFEGAACSLLAPEDELIVLCLHGAKERWQRLKWVCDVAFFLHAHPALDWTALYSRAAAQGCARMVNMGLGLAAALLQIVLPPVASAQVQRDTVAAHLVSGLAARIDAGPQPDHSPYRLDRFYWLMRERRSDRLRYALRTLFTARTAHYGRLPLPPWLRWLYGPLKLPWDYIVTPALRARRAMLRR